MNGLGSQQAIYNAWQAAKARAAAAVPGRPSPQTPGSSIPPEVQALIDHGVKIDTGVTDSLGDAYANTFGAANAPGASGSDLMVLPVGPQQSGGTSIGGIVVVVLIGVVLWFTYKKFKGG